MEKEYTVSQYILKRLEEIGVGHLFGVPGDYVLDFLDEVLASPCRWVGTCNELNAGYAADGYARMNGAAAAAVTYGVGGLSILNAVAGAYAEQVPMLVICGSPPTHRHGSDAMVHHLIAHYHLQLEIFKKVTIDAAILTKGTTAPEIVDRVIGSCMEHKLPAYLELPADVARMACRPPDHALTVPKPASNPASLNDCVKEAADMFARAVNPLMLAGVELMRHRLGKEALQLVETVEIPFATMLGSKSVLPELHPQFVGIYQGGWSRESVRQQVEASDCLLSLGAWMTDLDTGLFSMRMDNRRTISAGSGKVSIGNHSYSDVQLADFIRELTAALHPRSYLTSHPAQVCMPPQPFIPEPAKKLTAPRLYECLNEYLTDHMVLLAEPGDAFCAAPDFHIEEAENFIVQSYYASIGYCTPASLGVALARPGKRPVVLTGDGALQMTAQEISTLIRERRSAVIIVINNDGYLIERMLHEDGAYNDVQMWQYSKLPEVFGHGGNALGIRVTTEDELAAALETATLAWDKVVLIEAWLPNRDCSAGLERLGASFRRQKQDRGT